MRRDESLRQARAILPDPREARHIRDQDALPVEVKTRPRDRKMLGIGLMTLGFLCFAISDATAKFLTSDFHPLQVVWFRQLGLVAVSLWLLALQGLPILRTRHLGLQLSRGMVAALSSACFVFAVSYVPLADAVAVSFVAPFVVTVLGALILGETVGLRRWIGVSIGFAGTLIVIRPGMNVLHPAILLVLGAASLFAVRQIVSRILGPIDPTSTTIAYTAIGSAAILTVPMLLVWTAPGDLSQILLIALLGASAGAGEVFVIRALELAQAVTLAPLQYSMIVWSTCFGWLIFAQMPDSWTLAGAGVIVASGLYTLHRERIASLQGR
jgi:drug/metabolite transporter (DMT)-like permease